MPTRTWQRHFQLIRVVRVPGNDIFRNRLIQVQADQLRSVKAPVYDDLPSVVAHEADQVFLGLLQVLLLRSLHHLQACTATLKPAFAHNSQVQTFDLLCV